MHNKWDRRVIPKWRASEVAADLPESKPLNERANRHSLLPFDPDVVANLVKEWNAHPTIGVAADILNFSHVPEALPLIRGIAEQIAAYKDSVPIPLSRVAQRIVGLSDDIQTAVPDDTSHKMISYYQSARRLKQKLRIDPRNAIALVDIGLVYAALGQDAKALKAVLLASSLYQNHRFVLRSAARLLVHINDAERALYLLNRASRTLDDPWLLAPLISVTAILKKPQKHLRRAHSLFLSRTLAPVHLSELGGAIATLQVLSGDAKGAKKTFTAALVAPNDNTVAQAMWASEHFSIPITPREEWFNNQFSCEARYYQRHANADFEGAMKAAIHWFKDEPFSTRPMKAASFISGILGDYIQSAEYAKEGLRLDKDDIELRNNLIFALASQNQIKEASTLLQNVIHAERKRDGGLSGHSLANIGMLFYRTGELPEAEEYYRKAILYFKKSDNQHLHKLAIAFMAREAFLAMAPNASALVSEATEANNSIACAAGQKILSLLKGAKSLDRKESAISRQPKVVYDRATNTLFVKKPDPF